MTTIVLAVLIGGLVLKALVSAAEPKLVFFPTRGESETPANLGIPYTPLRLQTSDGEQLTAWQLEPEHPIADVLYFHGNGGNLSIWLPVLASLHQLGLRVLAVDYRGYGLSSGTPSEAGLYRDAEAVVSHAVAQRATNARPLLYWGRSLGGPVAAAATHVAAPDAVILESTFPDKAAIVRSNPLLRALNVFGRYRFATVDMLRDFTKPVLVLHAADDTIIAYSLGRELYERLSTPKRFVVIDDADHNDLFVSTRDAYWRPIMEFVATLLPRQ